VPFVQIIEYRTSQIEQLQALGKEFRRRSAGAAGAKPLRGIVAADRDRPGTYLSIVEFASAEAATEASGRPETREFFGRLAALMDGPPRFVNLEVVETWEM
jgi:hypothetical protein